MISLRELLFVLVLPVAWAVLMLGASRYSSRTSAACVGAALLGSYLIAHIGLFGWPTFPPTPARHGIAWAGGVGLVGGAAVGFACNQTRRAWLARAACVALGMGLIGWSRLAIDRSWSAGEYVSFAVAWIGATAMWGMTDSLARTDKRGSERMPRDGWIVAFLMAGLSAPPVVIVGSALSEGQLLGTLASAMIVGAAVTMLSRGPSMGSTGIGIAVMIMSMVWFDTMLWATLPVWMVVGFCAAPAAGFIGDLPTFRPRAPWIRSVVRAAAVSVAMLAVGGPSVLHEWMEHAEEFQI